MAHRISGIITSFRYTGTLPHVILVGNYCFLPLEKRSGPNYSEDVASPYEELTVETKKILKELSFQGKCCYIETHYFGGPGSQMGETWQDGKRIAGPLVSVDGIHNSYEQTVAIQVPDAINENLRSIGIYRHEGLDEFDSARLGRFRSNDEVIEEYTYSYSKQKPK